MKWNYKDSWDHQGKWRLGRESNRAKNHKEHQHVGSERRKQLEEQTEKKKIAGSEENLQDFV